MRLFTAIDLPSDIRSRLISTTERLRPLANLQWSAPEKLHITTKFIGEWPEPRLTELQSTLAHIKSDPFQVTIQAVHWMNPRVLTASVKAPADLAALASSTASLLATIGVPQEDRDYNPHVTLARNKQRRASALDQALAELQNSDFGTFTASAFILFQSRAGKYVPLKEYPLKK